MGAPLGTLTKSGQDELALQVRAAASAPASARASTPVETPPQPESSQGGSTLRPRHRSAALFVLGGAFVAVVATALLPHRAALTKVDSLSGTAASSTALVAVAPSVAPTVALVETAVATEGAAADASANAKPSGEGASAARAAGTEATSAASRARAKPVQKNHVERARHVPVPFETIDVSHAIDDRH